MNRYERAGVLDDIRAGKRVVLVDARRTGAVQTFREIAADADPTEWEYVRRANGAASHLGGGELIVMAIHGPGGRGLVCDVVAAENVRQMTLEEEQTVREFAALAGGELIPCSG